MSDVIEVLDANYVDKSFTNDPFDNHPPWLAIALKQGFMAIVPLDEEIHGQHKAVWAVRKNDGTIQVAEAGDKISNDLMFGLIVEKKSRNTLTWNDVKPKDN